jgi:excisionase family DNA binding protein
MNAEKDKLLSITQAAKQLGVHPLTVRNWTEKGYLPFYRTPGGHRRFKKQHLNAFLNRISQNTPEPPLMAVAQRAVQQAIAALPEQVSQPGLVIHSDKRVEITDKYRSAMRALGKKMLGLTIQYASGTADEAALTKGRELGHSYSKLTNHVGMSVSETVVAFNFFRSTIIEATFDAPHVDISNTQLFRRLDHFFNEVLLAIVQTMEGETAKPGT